MNKLLFVCLFVCLILCSVQSWSRSHRVSIGISSSSGCKWIQTIEGNNTVIVIRECCYYVCIGVDVVIDVSVVIDVGIDVGIEVFVEVMIFFSHSRLRQ